MQLEDYQHLETSGARGVTLINYQDNIYLAIPQLAEDDINQPANMNGGNSDTNVLIYRWRHEKEFSPYQKLAAHGAEDVCYSLIDNHPALAVANIRSGHEPDFNMHTESVVYGWSDDNQFIPQQSIPTFAAKGCHFFHKDNGHYLLLSQGVSLQQNADMKTDNSYVYRWNGQQFEKYQSLPGLWGYNIDSFDIDDRLFVSLADNVVESMIYEWKNHELIPFQSFAKQGGGRQLTSFIIGGTPYLAMMNLLHDSDIYRWDGQQFVHLQTLPGKGGRHAHYMTINGDSYLVRINFITGPREAPITEQHGIIYHWQSGKFVEVNRFTTFGGTACQSFSDGVDNYLVVSNSLSKAVRFRVDSIVYRIHL